MNNSVNDHCINSTIDREDRDIASHVNLFLAELKNNLPLQAVLVASMEDPAQAAGLLRQAMAAVEEQIHRAQALRTLAERYAVQVGVKHRELASNDPVVGLPM